MATQFPIDPEFGRFVPPAAQGDSEFANTAEVDLFAQAEVEEQ